MRYTTIKSCTDINRKKEKEKAFELDTAECYARGG